MVSKAMGLRNQFLAGLMMGFFTVLFAQLLIMSPEFPLWVKICFSLSVGYTGFIVGTGLYAVLCIPGFFTSLSIDRFRISAFYPYQTPEFYEVIDVISSLTFISSLLATILSFLIIFLEVVSRAYWFVFWNFVILMFLISSWFVMILPLIATQSLIAKIIKNAKRERLKSIQEVINGLLQQTARGDSQSIENIEKMQRMADSIFQSSNSILNFNLVGKFSSSIFLSIIPILLNTIFK